MTDTTTNLALPLIAAAQAQKHVTHNEALDILDVLVLPVVISIGANTPPGSPADGVAYVTGSAPTGAWSSFVKALVAYQNGAWVSFGAAQGWRVYNKADDAIYRYDGANWGVLPPTLPSYTVAGLPAAASNARKLVYVSNESGGAVPAFSDGTNWRRVTDRAVVS